MLGKMFVLEMWLRYTKMKLFQLIFWSWRVVKIKVYISIQIGVCYIETKSLDGETNLKMKNVSTDLLKDFVTEADVLNDSKRFVLKYEAPNPYLYRFYGELIDRNGS